MDSDPSRAGNIVAETSGRRFGLLVESDRLAGREGLGGLVGGL